MFNQLKESSDLSNSIENLLKLSTESVNNFNKLYKIASEVYHKFINEEFFNFSYLLATMVDISNDSKKNINEMKLVSEQLKNKLDTIYKSNSSLKNKISSSFSSLVNDMKNTLDIIVTKVIRPDETCIFSDCYKMWDIPDVIDEFMGQTDINPLDIVISGSYIMSQKLKLASEAGLAIMKAIDVKFKMIRLCSTKKLEDELNCHLSDIEFSIYKYFEAEKLAKTKGITQEEFDYELKLLGFN